MEAYAGIVSLYYVLGNIINSYSAKASAISPDS